MKFDVTKLEWTREPESFTISEDKIEIVTKPCISSGEEAKAYLEKLRETLFYCDISDCFSGWCINAILYRSNKVFNFLLDDF